MFWKSISINLLSRSWNFSFSYFYWICEECQSLYYIVQERCEPLLINIAEIAGVSGFVPSGSELESFLTGATRAWLVVLYFCGGYYGDDRRGRG